MYWFASKANDPSLLWSEKTFLSQGGSYIKDQYKPLMLIYGSHFSLDQVTPPTEKVWTGRGRVPVVLVRTDWEKDKAYWYFYVNDEACMVGIEEQPVEDGDAFEIVYTKAE